MHILRADMAFLSLRHKFGRFKIQKILSSAVVLSFLTVTREALIITLTFVHICFGKNILSLPSYSQPDYQLPKTLCL